MKLNLKEWMAKVSTWITNINTWKSSTDTWISGADGRYVNTTGDTMTGNLVVRATDTTERYVASQNSTGTVYLDVQADGKQGVWSSKLNKFLVYADASGKAYLNSIPFDTQAQTLTALGKNWYFTRIGRVVYIDAPNDTSANVSAGNNTIGTLNAGLRPVFAQYLKCTNVHADIRLLINTNGTVQLYSASAWTGAHNCAFSGYCYLAST